jgi:hypothetical protein
LDRKHYKKLCKTTLAFSTASVMISEDYRDCHPK